jgi:uncharacterized protein
VRVKISEIPKEGLTLSERLNPAALDLDAPELRFSAPLTVTALFQHQQDTVLVAVAVTGIAEETCSRCLKRTAHPYGEQFHLDYSTEGRLDLDVTDDVRQEILLSFPVKFLCRENCRGLCLKCGANLNERSCEHAPT